MRTVDALAKHNIKSILDYSVESASKIDDVRRNFVLPWLRLTFTSHFWNFCFVLGRRRLSESN